MAVLTLINFDVEFDVLFFGFYVGADLEDFKTVKDLTS